MDSDTRKRICKSMPKVELHAHLNGSISESILQQVDDLNSIADPAAVIKGNNHFIDTINEDGKVLELDECFGLFTKIHERISSTKILNFVTKLVIHDFSADNVVYLELRTTPKTAREIPTKEEYINCIIDAIKESQQKLPIVVKLILSVDRKMGLEEAKENVDLAIKYTKQYPEIMAGVELSGNPCKGNFLSLIPTFQKARENNLPISLHLPEVLNAEEAKLMLEFQPQRFGHAVFIHQNKELWNLLKEIQVPVEVCLTSNVVTKCSKSYNDHHVKHLYKDAMPFVVSTDDSGVFRISLSSEYEKLVTILDLNQEKLQKICIQSVDYIFANETEKANIRSKIQTWWDQHQN